MSRLAQRLGLLAVAALVVAGLDPAGVGGGEASAEESPYTPLGDFDLGDVADPRVDPTSFAALDVDLGDLRDELSAAPRAQGRGVEGAGLSVEVPTPAGGTQTFSVQRTQVMEPALAAANPDITTYAGRGVDDSSLTVVLDVTPMGFHAAVRSPSAGRAWFVDPVVNERGTTEHLAYYGAAVEEPVQGLVEPEAIPTEFSPGEASRAAGRDVAPQRAGGGPVDQRVYRVALMNDPSYAKYFGTENVLAEKVTLMNRVNQVYNDDLAITMVLVEDSEKTNLDTRAKAIGADGPCGNAPCYEPPANGAGTGELAGCGVDLLAKNRLVLGQLIGADNYDIGHIVLGKNGGGIAFLGVVGAELKGGGCTGLPFPEGDFFAIDYVAHEMGHQFDGPHTFNGTQGNCAGGNRTARTSVEPGSGSSVMAYAGICATDDLQPHTDPYFSQETIDNVTAYTSGAVDDLVEVQTVSLRGFEEPGDEVTLAFQGRTATIGRDDYNRASVDAAVTELTGRTVTITRYDYQGIGDPSELPGPLDERGFQVWFSATAQPDDPTAERVDVPQLRVPSAAEGFVGTATQGGPPANGGDTVNAGVNTAPRVVAPQDRTLPVRTPFALTASGRDADGDDVTFLWEQNDRGGPTGTALISNTKTNGPLFRVFGRAADVSLEDSLETPSPGQNIADGSPTRVFPDMRQVLAGNTNAATGSCPTPGADGEVSDRVRECFSEFLPTAAYLGGAEGPTGAMNFRVTARDGFAGGGGTAHDDVRLTLDRTAGPFEVTSQPAGSTLRSGEGRLVTWAVNGTEDLAAQVRITMSTDGGETFPITLAQSTANDGRARVSVPAEPTDEARIKVEAVRNYFFAVNGGDVTIDAGPEAPDTTITKGPPAGGFRLAPQGRIRFESSQPGSTYRCTLDGEAVDCNGTEGYVFRGLVAGTHEFTVTAVDSEGNADPSPAVLRWGTPYPARSLTRAGGWTRVSDDDAYRGAFLRTRNQGATLTRRASGVQRVGLVVGRAANAGRVAVLVGGQRVATRNLAADGTQERVLLTLPRLDGVRSGAVTVRTLDGGKPVRVEGLGILKR
ncbi:M12 family metallo-peptidase [Nocardioides sp. CFH 31398]|uniref:M12 family metallo-peptidase n=1 Tax=Nocardioides sp. CFH 31398 TaxID=2919579 RepID=UPI001F052493|nr:M12 family metallo-peptidase [Nocardioides sp. CFH 31398]MCH1865955.1 M12 family metallo-peptidase [Nocardioides sp. CFH 31398]